MSGFSGCMPKGAITRRELMTITLSVLPDQTLTGRGSAKTTLSDCRIADCILDAFAKNVRVEEPAENAKPVSIWAELSPYATPRAAPQNDMPAWLKGATNCSEQKEPTGGRMAPEVIQRIVRSSYGTIRKCYEQGLTHEPTLEGRVSVRFIIETDGRTVDAVLQDNTVPDCRVATCIRDEFAKLTYPAPKGGKVTVVYPIFLKL
jgi:hypothetical protein